MAAPSTWCSRQFVLLGSDFYHHDGSFLYKNSSIRSQNKHRKRQKVVSVTLNKTDYFNTIDEERSSPHQTIQKNRVKKVLHITHIQSITLLSVKVVKAKSANSL
jgi:hypothetical protein